MTALIVGFDIGATKTAIAVEPVVGGPRVVAELPSVGWEAQPADVAARWIAARLQSVLPGDADVAAIGIGAQGCDTPAICDDLASALAIQGIDAVVVNDAALLVPAAGLDEGIGLIAGTGAIAVGRDRAGGAIIVGGWGSILGDDAGAAGLVREATRSALHDRDRGLPDDGLLAALLEAFSVDDAAALARTVNDDPRVEHWAPKAPAVFAAADGGSARAVAVIDHGAAHLVDLVETLVRRAAVGRHVVAAGSVIVRQPRLFDRVSARLGDVLPGLTVVPVGEPPVGGALSLARQGLHVPVRRGA